MEAVLAGQFYEADQEGQFDTLGCRVRREVDDQRLGPRRHARNEFLKLLEELLLVVHGNADDVRAGDHRAVDMNRVARVGHEHGVVRVEDGEAEVRDALFGADGDDGLGLGIRSTS